MTTKPDDQNKEVIIRYEGTPNHPERKGELGLFRNFLRAFSGVAKRRLEVKIGNMSFEKEYSIDREEARPREVETETEKFAAEAAEINARHHERMLHSIRINEELRKIFSDDKISDETKALELSNLLRSDPEILAQLEKIEEIYGRLRVSRGLKLEVLQPESKQSSIQDSTPDRPDSQSID